METIKPIRSRPGNAPFSLPHNIEAEQAILGAVLLDNAVLDLCPWLEPGDFYEPVHGRIWGECINHRLAGRKADAVALKTLFEDDASLQELNGPAYLGRLAQAAQTVVLAVEYARLVRRLSQRRELHVICAEIAAKMVTDDGEQPVTILAAYDKRFKALKTDDSKPTAKHVMTVCNEILNELMSPEVIWPTGIRKLDESLGGGIRAGVVLGFEARPKQFKSGCAHSILLSLAKQNVTTAYFAYEMGAAQVAKRMLGHIGGFNSGQLRHRDNQAINNAVQAISKIRELPIWFVDCPGWHFSRMWRAAQALMLGYGVQVFVLDYWQLVAMDDPKENKADFLAMVAQWCADNAHEHGTSWIICSQQNRAGESYASDGLVKACDWHAVLHKHAAKLHLGDGRDVETLWMSVSYARDSRGENIGSEVLPVLYIDPNGPHLAQLPGT